MSGHCHELTVPRLLQTDLDLKPKRNMCRQVFKNIRSFGFKIVVFYLYYVLGCVHFICFSFVGLIVNSDAMGELYVSITPVYIDGTC